MRNSLRLRLFLLAALVCAGAAGAQGANPWKRLELGEGRYALRYRPPGLLPPPAVPPPLIVFLHGAGSSPDAWRTILEPHAEALGAVLLLPRAVSDIGFGAGDDLANLAAARALLEAEIPTDPRRRYLAGFSAGGGFALYLAHDSAGEWAAALGLGSPYRIVTALGEPAYKVPTRLVYGNLDPNFTGGSFEAWGLQLQRLGVPLSTSILDGVGHGGYSADTFSQGFGFLLSKLRPATGPCAANAETLCLHDGRFAVKVQWRDFAGATGAGRVTPARSRESGLFYFFSPDNWELQVKVLDGCGLNQHFWVYAAASTDVGYTLEIRDLLKGGSAVYDNAVGHVATTVTDVEALATCP